MKQLVITCDDCGLSEGINLATVELWQKGMATSASVMTNFQAVQHALELFALYPSLQVGVHLNLTEGFCLTKIRGASGLTHADGRFRSRPSLFARSLIPSTTLLELVENELAAQINVLVQAGLQPKHLTTHIHFHMFPALGEIVFKLAQRFRVPWIRAYSLRAAVLPVNPFLHKQTASSTFDRVNYVLVPDYVVGLKYWMSRSPEQLLDKILSLQGTVELVVHPCTVQDDTYPQDVYYLPHERFQEVRYLEQFSEILQEKSACDLVVANLN